MLIVTLEHFQQNSLSLFLFYFYQHFLIQHRALLILLVGYFFWFLFLCYFFFILCCCGNGGPMLQCGAGRDTAEDSDAWAPAREASALVLILTAVCYIQPISED